MFTQAPRYVAEDELVRLRHENKVLKQVETTLRQAETTRSTVTAGVLVVLVKEQAKVAELRKELEMAKAVVSDGAEVAELRKELEMVKAVVSEGVNNLSNNLKATCKSLMDSGVLKTRPIPSTPSPLPIPSTPSPSTPDDIKKRKRVQRVLRSLQ